MIWKILLVLGLVPLAVAFGLRWWLASRVFSRVGWRECRCMVARWPHVNAPPKPATTVAEMAAPLAAEPPAEASAREYGKRLRADALRQWREDDRAAAKRREAARRFGSAVPPLSAMLALLAVVLAKMPLIGGLGVAVLACALGVIASMLAIAPELLIIQRASRNLRESRCFPRSDDEDAVVSCARAEAWEQAMPPMLSALLPGKRVTARPAAR